MTGGGAFRESRAYFFFPHSSATTTLPRIEAAKSKFLEVKSPMVGTYYSAPEPGAKPYLTVGDRIGKFAAEDILFTFITLCGVGFIASVVGPQRIRPLIVRVGGRAARAGLALILGTIVYMLYCWAKS